MIHQGIGVYNIMHGDLDLMLLMIILYYILACSDYEREYQVHIYEAVHSPDVQAANHLSSPYTEIPRGRRVQ